MTAPLRLESLRRTILAWRPELVSFDVFDTLLWRPFRRPADLFFHLPAAWARHGVDANLDAGAAMRRRIEAEHRSRRRGDTPEVTLTEIMTELGENMGSVQPASLAEAELFLERRHLHPHTDLLALVADLHREGIPYALCSDMYLPSSLILEMVKEGAGRAGVSLPEPLAVLVSGERRSGKAGRLFEILVRETGVSPDRIVHVGDNPEADGACARRAGIKALHIPRTCAAAEEILDAEEEWIPAETRASPDFGLSASRKQALAELCGDGATLASPHAYGAFVVGPVFAAFAAWVVHECRKRGITRLHCAMREGVFLSRLLAEASEALGYPLEIHRIWASRFALRSAALAEATPKSLIDFILNVRGIDVRADLLREIGLLDAPAEAEWTAGELDAAPLAAKLTWIRGLLHTRPSVLAAIRRRGAQRAAGLAAHWRKHGLYNADAIYLVDVGWGGSIQNGFAAALRRDGWTGQVEGIYLGTDQRIRSLSRTLCPWSSYLYRAGLPLEAARIVQRTPELIEQACMSPDGSLREFTAAGEPVLFENNLPPHQLAEVAAMQDGMVDFGRLWWPRFVLAGGLDAPPDEVAAFEDRLRAVISRSIMDPCREEVTLFREWRHDSNNGSGDLLPVLGTEEAAGLVREGKVKHPWQLDWQICYWPQALFAASGRPWSRRLSGRTRFLVRCGEFSARLFGRFDPWPKVLRVWLALRLRLRDLKQVLLSR